MIAADQLSLLFGPDVMKSFLRSRSLAMAILHDKMMAMASKVSQHHNTSSRLGFTNHELCSQNHELCIKQSILAATRGALADTSEGTRVIFCCLLPYIHAGD